MSRAPLTRLHIRRLLIDGAHAPPGLMPDQLAARVAEQLGDARAGAAPRDRLAHAIACAVAARLAAPAPERQPPGPRP